jgi:hypothetical protein
MLIIFSDLALLLNSAYLLTLGIFISSEHVLGIFISGHELLLKFYLILLLFKSL